MDSLPVGKTVILIPTFVSIQAELFDQFLELSAWAASNNISILTIANRTHNDARNWLATGGGGFENPHNLIDQVDWLVWIDSDQVFTLDQLQILIDCKEKFCSGWYVKDLSGLAMVVDWNEKTFKEHGHMKFYSKKEIKKMEEPFEVDYCGFGFTKIHSDIFKKMKYPFFTNKVVSIGKYYENVSEDASFCLNAFKVTGMKPKVIPELKVGHLKGVVI